MSRWGNVASLPALAKDVTVAVDGIGRITGGHRMGRGIGSIW